MSIGDKPVNAMTTKEYKGTGELVAIVHSGLTYREWLIGMLASNPEFMVGTDRMPVLPSQSARWIITQADEIIKRLDKESE